MTKVRLIDFDNLTTAERDALVLPDTGTLIYNTTVGELQVNTGTGAAPVWTSASGGGGAPVTSVNGETGVVVLDADDIDDTTTAHKFVTAGDLTTLSNTSGTNSGDVSLAGTPNYITIIGQVITRALIDLASHITGILPIANGGTGSATKNFVDLTTNQDVGGIKTMTDNFNVEEGAGSGLTASTSANNIVITSDDLNPGLSIMTPAGGNSNIFFGETGNSSSAGRVQFVGSVDEVRIGTPGNLLRIDDTFFRIDERTEVRGQTDTPQFRVYSHTVSQGNPLISLYDTAGANSFNIYTNTIRAAGARDTRVQSVSGQDTLIVRSTGATGTRFDDSGDMTNFYSVGIGATPNANTVLDVTSTTKAVRLPRMTAAQASAITALDGMILYVTSTDATFTSEGYWVYEDGAWNKVTSLGGSTGRNVVTKTSGDSPYSAVDGDVVLCNTSGGAITVNLPAAASNANAQITVKSIDATNNVTIDGNGAETIDGSATATISTQYESITMVSDGSNWFII